MRRNLLVMCAVVAGGALAAPRLGPAQEGPGTMSNAPSNAQGQQAVCPPGNTAVYENAPPPTTMAPGTMGPAPMGAPPPPPEYTAAPRRRGPDFSPAQQSISVGGGVADFVRNRINDNVGVAGGWDFRYLAGTRSFVAFEAAYLGTAQEGNAVQPGHAGSTVTTQVSGSLRLNASRGRVQPFVSGGAGWANIHRSVEGDLGTLVLDTSKNGFLAPFSSGITGYIGRHAVLDARGSYNLITGKTEATYGARPDMWTAELRFGYAF